MFDHRNKVTNEYFEELRPYRDKTLAAIVEERSPQPAQITQQAIFDFDFDSTGSWITSSWPWNFAVVSPTHWHALRQALAEQGESNHLRRKLRTEAMSSLAMKLQRNMSPAQLRSRSVRRN
jgi:hypothetical protein